LISICGAFSQVIEKNRSTSGIDSPSGKSLIYLQNLGVKASKNINQIRECLIWVSKEKAHLMKKSLRISTKKDQD
jgi:hypothetical protein